MLIGGLISIPVMLGIALPNIKHKYRLAVTLSSLPVLILLIIASLRTEATLSLPVMYEANWGFDSFALVGTLAFSILGTAALVFNLSTSNKWQIAAISLTTAACLGVVTAQNYFALFLFWEFLTATTTLIVFTDPEGNNDIGTTFLLTHLVAGLVFLSGILLQFTHTGSLNILPPANNTIAVLFLISVGTKAAFYPLNSWLPNTYPSVSPGATVALSIYTTKAGVFLLARLFSGFEILAFMGAFMALWGVYKALQQTSMRTLLCFHIISQLGYMISSIGMGGPTGINGGLLHLFNHMIYKSLLLMIAAVVIYLYGSDHLKLGYKKPLWLTFLAVLASMAIIGLPPFNGFVSKSVIKYATYGSVVQHALALASVGTAISFSKFLYFWFIWTRNVQPPRNAKLPYSSIAVMGVLALSTIALGIWPAAIKLLAPFEFVNVYSSSNVGMAFALAISGLILFLIIKPLLDPRRHHDKQKSRISLWSQGIIRIDQISRNIGIMEQSITQLNNVQYIVATVTVVILFSILVFFTKP